MFLAEATAATDREKYERTVLFRREVSLPMNLRVLNGVAILAAVFSFASLSAQAPSRAPSGEDDVIWARIAQDFGRPDDKQIATMNSWRKEVGAKCADCHAVSKDPKQVDAAGNPALLPDDDSKQEYKVAYNMALMVQTVNKSYLPTAQTPLTCGICHRGRLTPEAYVPLPLPGHPGAPIPPAKR